MSDDTPWQPPNSDSTPGDGSPASPWSREASDREASDSASPDHRADAADTGGSADRPDGAVPPPPPPPGPADAHTGDTDPAAPAPTDAPTSGSGGRRTALVALAAAAVVAVGLAAIFAVRQFDGESAGGADSPEALVDELMTAIDGEDLLGMIDVMLPGERETIGEPAIDTVSELQRLEILSSDLDLGSLAGVDISIEEHTTEVERLGVDDIVMVHMSADAVLTVDGEAVPIGDLITDRLSDDDLDEMRDSSFTETDTLEFSMAAVEHDGAWYLSVLYTAAELARTEADVGALPAEGIGSVGADSPEGVVDLFADHVSALDLRGMLQMLDPAEAEALQRYAPLFLDEAERAIADEIENPDIRVTHTDVRVEGSGSERTLFIEGFAVEADIEGVRFDVEFADGCVRVDYTDEYGSDSFEQCATSTDTALMEQMSGIEVPESVDEFVTSFTEAFSDMEPVGIEVRERDGQWYVSPIATGTDAMLAVLRALDRDELDELIDLGTVAIDDFFSMAFGLTPGAMVDGDFTVDDTDDLGDADGMDGMDGMDGSVDASGDDEGWSEYEASPADECYSVTDPAEASACFETLIASGEAEEWEMPVSLRAPECGLTDLLWSGDVYALSDEEFTAAMSEASACFDALVADGYDELMVPYEVEELDCFEGRNPYQAFEDDYNDRVFECAFGGDD